MIPKQEVYEAWEKVEQHLDRLSANGQFDINTFRSDYQSFKDKREAYNTRRREWVKRYRENSSKL